MPLEALIFDVDGTLAETEEWHRHAFNAAFDAPAAARSPRWAPAMDLLETGEHFVLRADLPGLDESDVTIELEDNVLTVSGERRSEREGEGAAIDELVRLLSPVLWQVVRASGLDREQAEDAQELVDEPAQLLGRGAMGPVRLDGWHPVTPVEKGQEPA